MNLLVSINENHISYIMECICMILKNYKYRMDIL